MNPALKEATINVITEPTVTLVSQPEFIPHPEYEVPPSDDPVVRLGAFAAKGCYDSFGPDGRACEDNQRQIIGAKHGSVLEHLNFGFFIEGITRALTHELVRHRHFAYSQRSTRYTKEEGAAIVLEPYLASLYHRKFGGGKPLEPRERRILSRHLYSARQALDSYAQQVEDLMAENPHDMDEGFTLRKWARGKARNSLPHNLETRLTVTGNLRAWRWFLEARSSRHAEAEIRRLAAAVAHELADVAELYLEDFQFTYVRGYEEFTTENSKI